MAVEIEPRAKRNRTRSPSYPYLDLPTALEKAAVLWNVEGRHPSSVSVAMQHWGYKEESSTGYSCVAALKKFGLVDHDGMGETRQIKLSALALSILLDRDPGSADRRDAVRRAALAPRIHAELWERYGADLPSDQTLRRFLVIERNFNEGSVDELLAEYKETVAFAGLGRAGPAAPGGAPGGHATATTAALPVSVLPVPAPAPDAPRGVQKARERDGDGAVGSWQDQAAAAALQASASDAMAPASAPGPGHGHDRALATNSRAQAPAATVAGTALPAAGRAASGQTASPVKGRQTDLFGQHDDRFDERVAEELLAPLPGQRAAVAPVSAGGLDPAVDPAAESPAQFGDRPRRELPVPLDNGLVARVPYPMSEEDFSLLLDTLQLWKKRLVRA